MLHDFHLSNAQEARARTLHFNSIVFDMLSQQAGGTIFDHYPEALQAAYKAVAAAAWDQDDPFQDQLWADTLYWPFEISAQGESDLLHRWFLEAGLTCGTFSDIRVHDGSDPNLVEREERVLRYAQLPWVRLATTAKGIRTAKRDGVIAFYANCQPSTPAPRDLKAFDRAYEKGLRSFMLTYNRMDHIGVGCTERVDGGLSLFGLEVVAHCEALGMMVDVSHCGHLTLRDACRHARNPVNANHACAKAVYEHPRGKTDDDLRAIADTGGVIGILALPPYLSDCPRPSLDHMLDHLDHVAALVGWEHVAIGTDWPMQAPDWVLRATLGAELGALGMAQHGFDVTQRLDGYEDVRDLPNITRGLVARGYSDKQIRGILGENALRVMETVCG